MRQTLRKALQLCLFALVSYVLFYGIGVFLARTLGVAGYKSYSVAIATLTLWYARDHRRSEPNPAGSFLFLQTKLSPISYRLHGASTPTRLAGPARRVLP